MSSMKPATPRFFEAPFFLPLLFLSAFHSCSAGGAAVDEWADGKIQAQKGTPVCCG